MDGHQHHAFDKNRMLVKRQAPSIPADDDEDAATTTTTTAARTTTTTTTTAAPTTTTTTEAADPTTTTTTTTTSVAPTTTTTTTTTSRTTTPAEETTTTTTTSRATTTTTSAAATTSATSSTATTTQQGLTLTVVSTATRSSSSSSASSSGSSLANSSGSSDGPSTGAVVGIVAAALVGVIAIAAVVGWLFRKKWSRRDQDESPFDKDDFRRSSMLLDDDHYTGNNAYGGGGGHSPQMSEYSMNAMNAAGVGRSNTTLPGLGRGATLTAPRPPSSIVNHYQHQQMVPSFQPGQIIPNSASAYSIPQAHFAPNGGYNSPPPMDLYGGYPVPAAQQHQLDRGLYGGGQQYNQQQQQQHPYSPQQQQYHQQYVNGNAGAGLERNPSNGSNYSQQEGSREVHRSNSNLMMRSEGERPLSLVNEEDDDTPSSRSGTPVNSGVQQAYFSHGHTDSTSSRVGPGGLGPVVPVSSASNHYLQSNSRGPSPIHNSRPVSRETNLPGYDAFSGSGGGMVDNHAGRRRSLTADVYATDKATRAQRTLSVRNGGLDEHGRPVSMAESDDAYAGYT